MLWSLIVGGHELGAYRAHELCTALAHRATELMGEHAACVLNYVI